MKKMIGTVSFKKMYCTGIWTRAHPLHPNGGSLSTELYITQSSNPKATKNLIMSSLTKDIFLLYKSWEHYHWWYFPFCWKSQSFSSATESLFHPRFSSNRPMRWRSCSFWRLHEDWWRSPHHGAADWPDPPLPWRYLGTQVTDRGEGGSGFATKWVRLARNWTNLGL